MQEYESLEFVYLPPRQFPTLLAGPNGRETFHHLHMWVPIVVSDTMYLKYLLWYAFAHSLMTEVAGIGKC